ncbi:hypothetical protein Tco_1553393 [Tanacetum coccineum]
MVGPVRGNQLARRVIDDLIDFSGETSVLKYMKYFFHQQIANPFADPGEVLDTLMCLRDDRPDIMFAVCACSRFQVQPKASHMHAVKRIFRYLKGHPTLGLWYPKDSPLDLIAYSDSDYAGASLDRKSTIGGC